MRRTNENPGAVAYASQLYSILEQHEYTDALEIGGAWGISTLTILDASPSSHLTTVDIDPNIQASREVSANGLEDRWTFVVADSRDFWTQNEDEFDLVYIDGDHSITGVRRDLHGGWAALKPGGLLVLDDIVHAAHIDAADATEGYIYGVALGAWQFILALDTPVLVGGTPRLAWIKKPS